MPTDECRIAKLEANHESFMLEFREHCRREEIDAKERLTILLEVRDKQIKMTGFWAGASFVITALAGAGMFIVNRYFHA